MQKAQTLALTALGKATAACLIARLEGEPNRALIRRKAYQVAEVFGLEDVRDFIAAVAIDEVGRVCKDWPF